MSSRASAVEAFSAIDRLAHQVAKTGLDYLWVDLETFDKPSEVSINSEFSKTRKIVFTHKKLVLEIYIGTSGKFYHTLRRAGGSPHKFLTAQIVKDWKNLFFGTKGSEVIR